MNIKNKIDSFKSQLQKLENLFTEYKDINDGINQYIIQYLLILKIF